MDSPSASTSSLPHRGPNLVASSQLMSASLGQTSLSDGSPRNVAGSVFHGAASGIIRPSPAGVEDPRSLMLRAFVPHIAVHTSDDISELAKEKGFDRGLWQLLRPFGERVHGRITIRDSVGASKICDDFSVRFVELGRNTSGASVQGTTQKDTDAVYGEQEPGVSHRSFQTGGNIEQVEAAVDRYLAQRERCSNEELQQYLNLNNEDGLSTDPHCPFYSLYIKRLLSGIPMVAHETFSHPVACIIAISSRNKNPIETLRQLYDQSTRGEKRLPTWVNSEYLRYYVLVHDEEKDDISKSVTLFEQMKRHFGLHCHLLRIRSSHCIITDDDAIPFPKCEWISAEEELQDISNVELQDVEESSLCIYDSDATALRAFIREMVTQSIVPSMERCISTWNDQVASRRRGISGRFMNLSKKWTGFGARTSSPAGSAAGSTSNYDSSTAFYRPDTPEALMRKLADFAFMLRDWKLAQSTYDLCRSDYNSDKAWLYHAAANEMAAVSTLLASQSSSAKIRMDTIDQMLETATYSYITRCGAPYGALRCLLLCMELLKLRGGSALDEAARWGARILEPKLVGSVGEALIRERIGACYASRKGSGSGQWGSRTRKAAFWKVLAAEGWLLQGKYLQAELLVQEVEVLYAKLANYESLSQFKKAYSFLTDIETKIQSAEYDRSPTKQDPNMVTAEDDTEVKEVSEALDQRSHRKSLIGASAPMASLASAPLASTVEENNMKDDNFV